MKRFRYIPLVVAWAGLLWIVTETARDQPISEIFWINLAYIVGLIAVGIFILVAVFPPLVIRLRANIAAMIVIAISILFAIAAIDYFWLRDAIRAAI